MSAVVEWFREGGWAMFALLASCLLVFPLVLVHALAARWWSGLLAGLALVLPCLCGGFGTWQGRSLTESAIEFADPAVREKIREVGYAESWHPTQLAVGIAILAFVPFRVGEMRRLTRKPEA